MADAPVVKLGSRPFSVPRAPAGVFEDCEEEVKRFLACTGIPVGKDMGAIITLLHRALQVTNAAMTRDEVKAGLESPDIAAAFYAVGWSLGFEKKPSGEAQGPAAST